MPLQLGAFLNGASPYLDAAAKQAQQRQQQAALFAQLAAASQQGQDPATGIQPSNGAPVGTPSNAIPNQQPYPTPGQAPPPTAGGMNSPQGGPVNLISPNGQPPQRPMQPPPGATPPPAAAAPPQGQSGGQQGGGTSTNPNALGQPGGIPNMGQIFKQVMNSNLPNDQKMQVLEQAGAFVTPMEQQQQKMEMLQQKLQAGQDLLTQKMQDLAQMQIALQNAKNQGAETVQDKRNDGKTQNLSNDPVFKALTNDVSVAKAQVLAIPADASAKQLKSAQDKYEAANKKVADYKQKASAAPSADIESGDDRVTIMKDGQDFTVPKSQLQDALTQGYTQKQ